MKQGRPFIFMLLVLLALHILLSCYVLLNSQVIRRYDEAMYISSSIEFHKMLTGKEYKELLKSLLVIENTSHAKLLPLIGGLVLTLLNSFGWKDLGLSIIFTNTIFSLILLVSVYKIGAIFYNKEVGLLASILTFLCPIIFAQSRVFMLDFPLAACVSLSLLLLLKTNNFESVTFSLITGLTFGLTWLIKETGIIFLMPPFLYYSFKSILLKENKRLRINNVIVTLLSFLILGGAVYFNSFNRANPGICWKLFWSYYNDFGIPYYLKCFPLVYFGVILSLALLPLVLFFIFNFRKINPFLLCWFIFPLLVFSLSPNKNHRYLIPVLPAVFLMLSSGIYGFFMTHKIKKAYIIVLFLLVFLQYFLLNLSPGFASYYYSLGHLTKFGMFSCGNGNVFYGNQRLINAFNKEAIIPNMGEVGLLSFYKDRDFYLVKRLVDIFRQEKNSLEKKGKIIFVAGSGLDYALDYELKINDLDFYVDAYHPFITVYNTHLAENWDRYFLSADYLIDIKSGSADATFSDKPKKIFKEFLRSNQNIFKSIVSTEIDSVEYANVYKKIAYSR